jgi:redox-sensitive bicupin YhaK (pirin superfamily)
LRSPWPITLADLQLPPDAQLTLPLRSSERCFAYVMDGEVEIGRNRVRLARGNVAWIERGLEPGGIDTLPMHAIKRTRVLLFASPVAETEPTAPGARTRAYRALRAAQMAAREPQGSIA